MSRPRGSLSERAGDLIVRAWALFWWAAVAGIAAIVVLKATGILP